MTRPITAEHRTAEWPIYRIQAWHDTYNAAISGLLSDPIMSNAEQVVLVATCIANATHGTIPTVERA